MIYKNIVYDFTSLLKTLKPLHKVPLNYLLVFAYKKENEEQTLQESQNAAQRTSHWLLRCQHVLTKTPISILFS